MRAYIRRIGTRLCATFDNGQFLLSDGPAEDADMLRAAGITEESLPCEATLPRSWYEIAHLVHGS